MESLRWGTVFAANTLSIIALTLIWTWLFNIAGQSVFFAMLVHGTSNAVSGLIPRLVVEPPSDPWFGFKVGAAFALLIILFTRGRLGYQSVDSKKSKDKLDNSYPNQSEGVQHN